MATKWDKRLVYEVTGLRYAEDEYKDETSDDEQNVNPTMVLPGRQYSIKRRLIVAGDGEGGAGQELLLTGLN